MTKVSCEIGRHDLFGMRQRSYENAVYGLLPFGRNEQIAFEGSVEH